MDPRASDTELLRRASQGDEAAFHELVDRHAGHLYGLAYSLTGNAADAEDVVQETLAGAFRAMGSFREQASVRTWLVRILVRQAAKSRRSRRRWRMLPIAWGSDDSEGEDRNMTVVSGAAAVDQKADISEMLRSLSPEHREVMMLRELEGLSYEEMAKALGVPRGTVESRLHRARQELRERFKDYL